MWLLVVEALAALALLLFIVWWTMFAGRQRGERESEPRGDDDPADAPGKPASPTAPPPSGPDEPHGDGR